MSGEFVIPSVCLVTANIWSDRPALQPSDRLVLQLHVTAQFYLESKGKYILEAWGMRACWPKRHEEKRGPQPSFGFSFYTFLLLPLGLPCVNWASQECCLFYLRFSLWSLDLPLFYFCGFFFLIFSHRHSGLFFSYPNYLTQVWEHVMNSVLGEDHFIWSAYYIFIICNIIMVRRYPSSKVRSSSCTLLE